jgi:hypothetical protein
MNHSKSVKMRKTILFGFILLIIVSSIVYLYYKSSNPAGVSFNYGTERIDQPSTDVNGTAAYVFAGKSFSEEDLRREVFDVSAMNGSVSFKRIFFETICPGEYTVLLERKADVFSVIPIYSESSCDRYSARSIEGTIGGIAPGKYVLKAAGMSRDFEIK